MRRVVLAALLLGLPSLAWASERPAWLRLPEPGSSSEVTIEGELTAERRESLLEEDAPFTDLLWRVRSHIGSDGFITYRTVQVRHFLTASGADSGGQLEMSVQPSHETLRVEAAYVLKPGGQRLEVAPDTFQIQREQRPRIFSDLRRVTVPMPGLEPGATAVLVYSSTFRTRDWPLPWGQLYSLQILNPVEDVEIAVSWDADVPPPRWRSDDADLECEREARSLSCVKTRVPALEIDPDYAALQDRIPELVVAPDLSWNEVAGNVRDIVAAQMGGGVPADLVNRLVDGSESDEEKWQALYRFVAGEIRYLGISQAVTAVVPRPPRVTLDRRFGDCKDKVTLLLALAREAGIDAYPALVGIGRDDLGKLQVPATSFFDHMIACRADPAGDVCADVTVDAATSMESMLPVAGNVALDLRPDTAEPRKLERPEHAWIIEEEGTIELLCDGGVRAELTRRLSGMAGLRYRESMLPQSVGQRRRAFEEEFRQAAGYAASRVSWSHLEDPSQPLVTTAHYEFPGVMAPAQAGSHTDMPPWLRYHGLMTRSDNRVLPYRNPGMHVRSSLRYSLCDEVEARFLGPALELESPFGSLRRQYRREGSEVRVETELSVRSAELPAERIPAFNRFVENAVDQTQVWLGLRAR